MRGPESFEAYGLWVFAGSLEAQPKSFQPSPASSAEIGPRHSDGVSWTHFPKSLPVIRTADNFKAMMACHSSTIALSIIDFAAS
jgi:hypothetical protein